MIEFLAQHWFLNTILVTIGIGLAVFINKIFVERKYNHLFVALVLYAIQFIFFLLYALFAGLEFLTFSQTIITVLFGIQIYAYTIIMMKALVYLPTSTYFVSVRLLSSFTLLFIGIIFFGDVIGYKEVIGFIIGAMAMMLLFEKEIKETLDYKKGTFLLLLGVGILVFGHTVTKVFANEPTLVPTLLAVAYATAFVCSLFFGAKTFKENTDKLRSTIGIGLVQSVFVFYYFIMLFSVYATGALGISYKIQSFSPFIPIILASLVYKEKISLKKKVALVFVAVSLWFFV